MSSKSIDISRIVRVLRAILKKLKELDERVSRIESFLGLNIVVEEVSPEVAEKIVREMGAEVIEIRYEEVKPSVEAEEKPYAVAKGVSDPEAFCRDVESKGYVCTWREVPGSGAEVFYIKKEFLERIVNWLNERGITLAQIEHLSGEFGEPARLAHEYGLIIKTGEGWKIV